MGGRPSDMDRILAVARRHGVKVLEDACQAIGGSYKGRRLATLGEAGAFSFNQYKNITCGEGGALADQRPEGVRAGAVLPRHGVHVPRPRRRAAETPSWATRSA